MRIFKENIYIVNINTKNNYEVGIIDIICSEWKLCLYIILNYYENVIARDKTVL